MGLYDEIWWEAELPAGHPPDNRLFQTKSLDPCLDRYVVTPLGRLLLVGNGFQDDAAFAGTLPGQEGIDVDFYGDLRLVSNVPVYEVYSARFTHGTLEWIRSNADEPSSPLAAAKQKFLVEGAHDDLSPH